MALRLPQLQIAQAIVDSLGRPTTFFHRFFNVEYSQAIQKNAQDTQDQIDRLNRVLAGTEPFTAVNVEGTIVAEDAGLADGIVDTPTIANSAVTDFSSSYTAASLTLGGTVETLIQTVSYVSTGEGLAVRSNFFLNVWHPSGGGIDVRIRVERGGIDVFDQTFGAIGGDFLQGWQSIDLEDAGLPAGTYTWNTYVTLSNNDAATQTAQSRFMSVREYKR